MPNNVMTVDVVLTIGDGRSEELKVRNEHRIRQALPRNLYYVSSQQDI
jgi:hypothetical protein